MTMRRRLGIFTTCGLALGTMMVLLLLVGEHAPTAQAPQNTSPRGQTATRLANGRWLVLGGEGAEATAAIIDPRTNRSTPLAEGSWLPRAGHTATLLPDGQVLIVGGLGTSGQVVAGADLFDPQTGTIIPIPIDGGTPRAWHTATLLTDGHVLVTGGTTTDLQPEASLEIWNVQSQDVTTVTATPSQLGSPRSAHTATLLGDGRVALAGGTDGDGRPVGPIEIVDPATQQVIEASLGAPDPTPVHVTASIPGDGAQGVPVEVRLALRLSKPLRTETVTADTVTLSGPDGPVEIALVPAEGGRLVFVSPRLALSSDTTYSVQIEGASDLTGVPLVTTSISFVTAEETVNTSDPIDEESWTPNATSVKDGWRSNRPASPWQKLPPLAAPPGATALAGQVLRLDGRPLADVTLAIEGRTTRTNGTGRFLLLLEGLASGEQELVIDARTASRPTRTYGLFEARVRITAGVTTVLPFTIWSPLLDTVHQVTIPSPTTAETVVTTPLIPGLELHLPARTVIRDHEGEVARTISITPIPVDRPPFPMPADAEFPVFFTIQPGGAYIHSYGASKGAWLVYPNARQAREGKRVQFFNYDPEDKGWFVYGMGTVKGTRVVPDAKTRIYEFTGASFNDGNTPPPGGATPGGEKKGDPVDPSTGAFVMQKTDLYLPDVLPIAVTRTYNSLDPEPRPFGRGMTQAYAIFQHSEQQLDEADLYLPDGGKVHYVRVSANGLPWDQTVLEHTATPTAFYKSRIAFVGSVWHLTLTDGTVYVFGHGAPLQAIRDRYGNEITLSWSDVNLFGAGTGKITRVTSPNGRWIEFTYDAGTTRVHQAKDNIGRTVTYTYDANGNLSTVTDPDDHVTTYTYDTSNRMLTIKDGRNIVFLTNEYTNGRVTKQTLADAAHTYLYAYTVDGSGNVMQTEITDPRGTVERLTFNPNHYLVANVQAAGTAVERTIIFERQPGTNLVTAVTDGLNRRSEFTYDPSGRKSTHTRLAGSTDAVTTAFTYEPQFSQPATVTDSLEHTWTTSYDAAGRMTGIIDPLGHQTTIVMNGAGQVTSVTDPMQHTWQFGYTGGDFVSLTNALGQTTSQVVDAAGRVIRMTDPLGHSSRLGYDKRDLLTSLTDGLGGQTLFTYDPNGQLLSLTDAKTQTTSYTYDASDRVATRTDPLLKTETNQYDANSNLVQTADRKGQVTTRQYDALDRLTLVTYADTSTTQYVYDAGDRLTQVIDSIAGTIIRNYDGLDRLIAETTPEGNVSYTYDTADRRTTMTVAGQPTVMYGYDDANRLTSITQGATVASLTYDDADRRTALTLSNGIITTYGYDEADRLTSLTYTHEANTLGTLTYTYDAAGRRTAVGGTWARTGLPPAVATATYDAANRVMTWGGTMFSHDASGNLASDGLVSYLWNARNQLTELSGGASASFQYDGFRRRSSRTINGTMKSFLYDGQGLVQELSGATPTANLFSNFGTDEVFRRIDSAGGRDLLMDALGSTIALADASGTVQTTYGYQPFGATNTFGVSSTNAVLYTGRENDSAGLYYYRARYYHSTLGKFLSEDPIRHSQQTNLYVYVDDDPVNVTDPTGEVARKVPSGMGMGFLMKIIHYCDFHRHRNMNNRCPPNEPKNDPAWTKDFWGSGKYRNNDGSECKYDKCGKLERDENGNYTYNYGADPFSARHILNDVLPHFYCWSYVPNRTSLR